MFKNHSIYAAFKNYVLLLMMFLMGVSNVYSAIKAINIDDTNVTLPTGYSLYLSGICKDKDGKYGLVSFSSSSNIISTSSCQPQASVKSSASPYFASIPAEAASASVLKIATPIKSGRFYFYIAKTGTDKDSSPDWTLFETGAKDASGNFGLAQPNVENLLSNDKALYPFAIIEITKDEINNQTYYADGTLIDGVSPLFASITRTGGSGPVISGYTIPSGMKTSDIVEKILKACDGKEPIPSQDMCKLYLSVAGKKDILGNSWIIAPTEIAATKFSKKLNANTLSYLKALDGVSWSKSTYCGTFHIGDGSDTNCTKGTLCSTLGHYFSSQCFDKASNDEGVAAKQYPIMFNSSHGPTDGQACIVAATEQDGNFWMESPCWDLRTVYAAAMPAASRDCAKWPKYGDLSKLDAFLAKGVALSLTKEQQASPERGACEINQGGTSVGRCKWSDVDCDTYIKSFKGNYNETYCTKAGNPPEFLRCACPVKYTKEFSDKNDVDTLCKNPESINAISSWASVFLAATPDIGGTQGLLQSACKKNGVVMLTPECVANYVTAPGSSTIQDTDTRLFSSTYYAWLLQFLYVDNGKLSYPQFDPATGNTIITDTDKSHYLSGFGPTYVFPFSDFVSGDKALVTWNDDDSYTITIKLNYDVGN
jgi:hypothetical protein